MNSVLGEAMLDILQVLKDQVTDLELELMNTDTLSVYHYTDFLQTLANLIGSVVEAHDQLEAMNEAEDEEEAEEDEVETNEA